MKLLIPLVLLSLNSGPCFSKDLEGFRKELSGLGTAQAALAQVSVPEVSLLQYYGDERETLRLQKAALANPDKFIDEHTPNEVAVAFGFEYTRFQATDPIRIQDAVVHLTVDLTRQRLIVESPALNTEFKISSGVQGHRTAGSGKCFFPDAMEEMHYSSLYNNAPMPHSVFFNGNIAVHATSAANEALLGSPASHGCVRLSRINAATVFDLVRANGKGNTAICVQGVPPK